jgi:RND family efflux transporter MFP subunit
MEHLHGEGAALLAEEMDENLSIMENIFMKKKILLITLSGVILIITVFILISFTSGDNENNSEDSTIVHEVVKRDIGSRIVATGIIKPQAGAEIIVNSRVTGIVENIYVNIGDFVTAGQPLIDLDNNEYRVKYEQNLAALEKAEADYEYALLNLERQQSLVQENYITQQQLDALNNAISVSESLYKIAQANLDYSRLELSYTSIKSPMEGVITSIYKQKGETVVSNSTSGSLLNIIDLSRLELQAYIDEIDIGRVNVGCKALFTVDTFPDTEFTGTVVSIYPVPVIEDTIVNYIAVIDIDNLEDTSLHLEMTANVNIILEIREDVVAIPTKSINRNSGIKYVELIIGEEIVQQEITTGWKDNGYMEITSGLNEGDIILIRE